jgi:hypothetical protein
MTRFLDGPATDHTLLLKRAPKFLRAVQGPTEKWDALDQLTDTPSADERVVAYELVNGPWTVHLNMGRNGCGWYQVAEYRVIVDQPGDDVLRSTVRWREWCANRIGKRLAADGRILEELAR